MRRFVHAAFLAALSLPFLAADDRAEAGVRVQPMPHAIFFRGGFAIRGSYEISRLGGPASHGWVRLHPAASAILFGLVQREGMRHTTIVVQ
jgi:hypothetical protein